ncbi:MAG TPA: hypothetical protein DCQ31_10475, partial [Bacteroidales bacterium]|nr:hypothetical protein [Bacteroidales bacterium]
MNTAFISYGRRHSKEFAANLHKELIKEKFDVWFDMEDIPPGVDFREQIDHGIEIADNFIFIISPHSVLSEYCLSEINTAVRYGKRIIPLLHVLPSDTEIKQMHPVVEKLNWIYFDAKTDITQSYKQLFIILNSHKEYVHTHTNLLSKALKWSKNPNNTSLLLFDDERMKAEQWLRTEFSATDNTSCRPSEFHADFICESKENAELHSGEVFFCYGEEDDSALNDETTTNSVPYKIHKNCQLNAVTTWIRITDTTLSGATDDTIATGIEQCNVFLFFLTKATVNSEKRMAELKLAISFNKKIIPVELEKLSQSEIPSEIKKLKPIRFQATDDIQFDKAYRRLYAEILTDYAFIQLHTKNLTRAIRWNKQNRNAALLLKNFELEVAENWLNSASKRQTNLPVELHSEFINASKNAIVEANNFEIFIIHASDALDFSSKIIDELRKFDKSVWVEKENIDNNNSEEIKYKETMEGMEASDNIVIVGSNRANASEILTLVEQAVQLNKRIIVLNYKEVPTEIKQAATAEIDFTSANSDFKSAIIELIRLLNLDRDYLHSHTLWLQKANTWSQFQQKQEYLLRGTEFQLAEQWLQKAIAEDKKPKPSEQQIRHINESKLQLEKEARRKKRNVQILRALLSGISVLFVLSVIFGINSLKQKNLAESAHKESNRNYQIAKSNNLQILAKEIEKNDPTKAFAISIAAIEADSSTA